MSERIAFVGLDIETTGLGDDDDILEIGIVGFDVALEPVAECATLVSSPDMMDMILRRGDGLDPYVRQMHEDNGLWDDLGRDPNAIAEGRLTPSTCDVRMRAVLDSWSADFGITERLPMLGSSVHFDRRMMAHTFPRTLDWFSYRNIDTSTLYELLRAAHPEHAARLRSLSHAERGQAQHRVLGDINASAQWLKALCRYGNFDSLFPTTSPKEF